MGPKIFKASKFDVVNGNYSFQNICRNTYGEVLQVKYYEDSYGVAYFLSLHRKCIVIFVIETKQSGSLEVSMLKNVPFPDNEFSGEKLEIVVSGTDKVYLRDDSNAYEISLSSEYDEIALFDHSLRLKISTFHLVLIILSRQDFNFINFKDFQELFVDCENLSIIEYALKIVNQYRSSMDIFGSKFLFLSILRFKLSSSPNFIEFVRETSDYEILAAAKSDSHVI